MTFSYSDSEVELQWISLFSKQKLLAVTFKTIGVQEFKSPSNNRKDDNLKFRAGIFQVKLQLAVVEGRAKILKMLAFRNLIKTLQLSDLPIGAWQVS